jgi:hypothetical protein
MNQSILLATIKPLTNIIYQPDESSIHHVETTLFSTSHRTSILSTMGEDAAYSNSLSVLILGFVE